MKKLICVYPESLLCHKTILKSLVKDSRVAQLFNTDLSHLQQYLFTKLKIEPTSKVEVQYDKNESRLIKITKINEDLAAAPPPFSILYFEIHTRSSKYNLGDDLNDAITEIKARSQHETEISFEGSEDSILKDFSEYVQDNNPDILFSSSRHSRSITALDYLFTRMRNLGLDLQIARDK
jgi:DNA polymerase elongation subunit (family B)